MNASDRMTVVAGDITKSDVDAIVNAANEREWPTVPIIRGAHQQPMKNPTKWADPRRPICAVLKLSSIPEMASRGPRPPVPSCRKITERNRAAKEIRRRIFRGFQGQSVGVTNAQGRRGCKFGGRWRVRAQKLLILGRKGQTLGPSRRLS